MPLGKHFCSVGLGMKLASLMSAPEVHDITTIDKLTSLELIRLILQKSPPANSDELTHLLSLIFKSCATEVPKAKDLKVLLKKIHLDTRIEAFQHIQNEATLVPLYDIHACRWNWPLPDSHLDKLPGQKSKWAGEKSSTDQEEMEGENSGTTNERLGDWVFINETSTPTASESQAESVGQPEDDEISINASSTSGDRTPVLHEIIHDPTKPWTTEQIFVSFYNILAFALLQQPALAQRHNLSRVWSASNSSRPIHGNEIARKPDLTLLDDIEARWDTIKAQGLPATQAPTVETLHTVGLHFNLECIGFDPTISILKHTLHHTLRSPDFRPAKPSPSLQQTPKVIPDAQIMENDSETNAIEDVVPELAANIPPNTVDSETNAIEDAVPKPAANIPPNMVPLIEEIPRDPLCGPLPEPIGKIRVNQNTYNILDLIFSTQGLVGCGTACYLVRKDEEEYIVKDHWVLGGKSEVLNEICMMEKMDGIHGVPHLVKYWLVEMEPGEVDEMVKYRQKVPHSIQGTSCTHVRLVLKPRVRPLYQFCSHAEFLTPIRDIMKIQKQAVEQNQVLHHDCSLNNAMIEDDGSGSHGMLIDWEFAVEIIQGNQYGVGGTGTIPFMLRSLLFQLYLNMLDPSDECLGTQASGSKPYPAPMITHVYNDNLESMFYIFIWVCIEFRGPLSMKRVLPVTLPQYSMQCIKWITREWSASTYQKYHYTMELAKQFDPYFKSLLPLALEWYELIKEPKWLLFNNVIDLLDRHITTLLKEDSPELLVSKWVILSAADETRQKRVVDHRWTMEIIPKLKRNKTG
ncbi:hypothetical protein DFJ58DRAFT_731528 [Suillus subalutaceus]|uniref:uncharacterized protein n=1 Tax=Suillus subalutaceus TaxID=48586 RepID=UPI001B876B12|nr:uncharacterized protein DFJ58DRAFT_731528 [Suillus subalutaceus]KAG1843582.1 hypothetical protein DFJ58DRAFT_731528 [Suillus subalutaceus]